MAAFDLGVFLDDAAWERLGARLSLSQREVQISRLVIEDRKETLIAQQLGMSVHTVHTHLDRLYQKLNVNSRVALVTTLVAAFLELTAEPQSELPPICGTIHARGCPRS